MQLQDAPVLNRPTWPAGIHALSLPATARWMTSPVTSASR